MRFASLVSLLRILWSWFSRITFGSRYLFLVLRSLICLRTFAPRTRCTAHSPGSRARTFYARTFALLSLHVHTLHAPLRCTHTFRITDGHHWIIVNNALDRFLSRASWSFMDRLIIADHSRSSFLTLARSGSAPRICASPRAFSSRLDRSLTSRILISFCLFPSFTDRISLITLSLDHSSRFLHTRFLLYHAVAHHRLRTHAHSCASRAYRILRVQHRTRFATPLVHMVCAPRRFTPRALHARTRSRLSFSRRSYAHSFCLFCHADQSWIVHRALSCLFLRLHLVADHLYTSHRTHLTARLLGSRFPLYAYTAPLTLPSARTAVLRCILVLCALTLLSLHLTHLGSRILHADPHYVLHGFMDHGWMGQVNGSLSDHSFVSRFTTRASRFRIAALFAAHSLRARTHGSSRLVAVHAFTLHSLARLRLHAPFCGSRIVLWMRFLRSFAVLSVLRFALTHTHTHTTLHTHAHSFTLCIVTHCYSSSHFLLSRICLSAILRTVLSRFTGSRRIFHSQVGLDLSLSFITNFFCFLDGLTLVRFHRFLSRFRFHFLSFFVFSFCLVSGLLHLSGSFSARIIWSPRTRIVFVLALAGSFSFSFFLFIVFSFSLRMVVHASRRSHLRIVHIFHAYTARISFTQSSRSRTHSRIADGWMDGSLFGSPRSLRSPLVHACTFSARFIPLVTSDLSSFIVFSFMDRSFFVASFGSLHSFSDRISRFDSLFLVFIRIWMVFWIIDSFFLLSLLSDHFLWITLFLSYSRSDLFASGSLFHACADRFASRFSFSGSFLVFIGSLASLVLVLPLLSFSLLVSFCSRISFSDHWISSASFFIVHGSFIVHCTSSSYCAHSVHIVCAPAHSRSAPRSRLRTGSSFVALVHLCG